MISPKPLQKPKKPKLLIRQVVGKSMLPTLRPGRIVIAVAYRVLRPGDVVIVRHAGLEKIKRIRELRDGHVYVTGDNQAHSTDSRTFGWLAASTIVAKVVWPVSNITKA